MKHFFGLVMFHIVSEMEIMQHFTHSSGTLGEACKIEHGEHRMLPTTVELGLNDGLLQGLGIILSLFTPTPSPTNGNIVTVEGWLLLNFAAQMKWNRNPRRSISGQGSPNL